MRLISIIGEDISQLIPVIYHYQDTTTEHILVCDTEDLQQAKRLRHGIQRFAESYQLSWKVLIVSIDASDISSSVEGFKKRFADFKECYINTSASLPILAGLLGEIVLEGGGCVINYDAYSNKLYFLEPNSHSVTCDKISSGLTLHAFLTLLDYTIVAQSTQKHLRHRKKHILALYKESARFRKLRYALLYPEQNRHFQFHSYRDLLHILEQLHVVEGDTLIRNQQKVLSGDIFEEYVFWLCEALGFDDIAMGVQIDFDCKAQEPNKNYRIHNEFDILLMKDNKIYTVECKYSSHLDGLDLVYKYDAIIDYFGSSTKAIILNISSKPKKAYLGMKSSQNFSYSTLRRARHSSIYVYHESVLNVKKFQQVLKEQFNLGGKDEDR